MASAGSHTPRKRFGQHFLHDPHIINRIVTAIDPQPDNVLVEIGPGPGAITLPLLERCGTLIAVELDRDVIPRLQASAAGKNNLHIVQGDALKTNLRSLGTPGRKLRLVGNLPYNISTPLLFHCLDQVDVITDMHFMLQKEVVQRMAAAPGGREYGRLSVMLALHCRVEPLFSIGSGAFSPPPRVGSTFVRLIPHIRAPFPLANPERFARLVNQAFSRRRKTLRNALAGLANVAAMQKAGLDPTARPENLSAADFARLADSI
ncbi:MAG: 16S rRNA (adenine(1518)-N(6)/adenine(1519)-N(6))-dimethyltransferase RsmA [Gammaproteobacteria bacterium]|nr:16S rRNA (adenine(1518)-N(6)/adenine(1519)-N(6))-dimethyltransferase RsmA [Gammaproteobacteria bacterium]MDE2346246.1 16S rRNA (adenine(1518)-N(6)/adenine(1519)-N(6))-dimethyltransferase RsmA [Gammaproteobacteria bacterium]